MEITIKAFGPIAEITGQSTWTEKDIASTDELQTYLQEQFPAIQHLSFKIAVDKKLIEENTSLNNQATVALLPAFSGG